ncbi:16S rRNA (guanine(966)-N(2))-methyltransferase RsmD [Methylobacillus sp.]|uniref:16S rRNA (guanine(966)-N(2))-methyltransferase RsmD n=1 Tax=Methylobacillus sp. TaxID=56818 RepID=UPI0012C2E0DD|nr:16S rRNA (guanine(966)-N(2))-methyltransferase RsmD [Methylobacillus sp.]MPS49663.1 16S rRNA (guanine(966)-N(2))-methyltransferase RsmD [Methylobacillus sp.]
MAANNRVRISGGEWRSRLLSFPDVPGLRPTPDRVRQTVFNWLGQDMHGRRCLDLFAGTGAMGFEALSRGASAVVLVEKSALAAKSLQQNQSLLKAGAARILQQDAVQFLAQNRERFDVIFLDPPYQQGWLPKLLPCLPNHLAEGGVVYVEAEFALCDDALWQVIKQGKAGNVFYHLLKLADRSTD